MPEITRTFRAPPDEAWTLLADTRHWTSWGPTVTAVDPGDVTVTPGLDGRVRTPVGLWLPFTVTDVDPGRRWTWDVAGVGATDHRVEGTADGCRVVFGVPRWAPFYAPVCALALRRIGALLAS